MQFLFILRLNCIHDKFTRFCKKQRHLDEILISKKNLVSSLLLPLVDFTTLSLVFISFSTFPPAWTTSEWYIHDCSIGWLAPLVVQRDLITLSIFLLIKLIKSHPMGQSCMYHWWSHLAVRRKNGPVVNMLDRYSLLCIYSAWESLSLFNLYTLIVSPSQGGITFYSYFCHISFFFLGTL